MADISEQFRAVDPAMFEDDQRSAEGPSPSIFRDGTIDFSFGDASAFSSTWTEELPLVQSLKQQLFVAKQMLNMVYTYRSVSKCIPQVARSDQENKQEIYEKTVQVLEPEIKKIRDFMAFQGSCVKFFVDSVAYLGANRREPSETLLFYLIRTLDLLSVLDSLKNMKASFNNDFSAYKRAAAIVVRGSQEEQAVQNQSLYIFLANQNQIINLLREQLKNVPQYERVIIKCVDTCLSAIQNERYLLPSEKHCFLRALPFAISLLDVKDDPRRNIFKSKTFSLQNYVGVLRENPVVSAFCDMQFPIDTQIRNAPNFDKGIWESLFRPGDASKDYLLVNHVASLRARHDEFIIRFSQLLKDLRAYRNERAALAAQSNNPALAFEPLPVAFARDLLTQVLQGLQLMSEMTSRIVQQSAYKFNKPNMSVKDVDNDYERAVRLNYSPEELTALVEVIAMSKGLSKLFLSNGVYLFSGIRTAIHAEVQEFVQVHLPPFSADAQKRKKMGVVEALKNISAIIADWAGGVEPIMDKAAAKKKGATMPSVPVRQVGPTLTQITLVRNIVYALTTTTMRKDVPPAALKVLDEFYSRSFYYPYLLSMEKTVMGCTDIGELWYREFYLELCKVTQFPIATSLPSILVDHIIKTAKDSHPELIEYALYPLFIYNDAASFALNELKQQFLYNEVEAEINLAWEQMIFLLSKQIYAYYKTQASVLLMNKPYKKQLEMYYADKLDRYNIPNCRFDVLLTQRHIQLLGRTVNLRKAMSKQLNSMIRSNIEYAIGRYEAANLTGIYELDQLLINIRVTHTLISKVLELDSWDTLFHQGDESCSVASFHGRIVIHTLFEVLADFGPNFNYNSTSRRFVAGEVILNPDTDRSSAPKNNAEFMFGNGTMTQAYQAHLTKYGNFFGVPHMHALIHVLGHTQIPLLIQELYKQLSLKVFSSIGSYMHEIAAATPQKLKLPGFDLGSFGGYGNFQMLLNPLITYPELKSGVFRHLKEFGNIVCFIVMCDEALKNYDLWSYIVSSPALGVVPNPEMTQKPRSEEEMMKSSPLCNVTSKTARTLAKSRSSRCGHTSLEVLIQNSRKAYVLHKQRPDNVSIFATVIDRLRNDLSRLQEDWSGANAPADNGVLNVEGNDGFYKWWCCLQFILCMDEEPEKPLPPKKGQPPPQPKPRDPPNKQLFGDSINYAAMLFIHLLGQRHRFEALSFTYHILKIEDGSKTPSTDRNVQRFLHNARDDQVQNEMILDMYETFQPMEVPNADLFLNPPRELKVEYYPKIM